MNEEERKDYLKYIENYTINDLADIFNTQNFVIQDKDKFNEILLYYHFKQNEEIEQLQQENKQLKDNWNKLKKWLRLQDILANDKNNPQTVSFKKILEYIEHLERKYNNE